MLRILESLLIGSLLVVLAYGNIINIPDVYLTIQEGIDAASNGDTVLVDTGTYVENINFNGKNIEVASLFLTTGDTSYISQTVINGDSSGTVVTFENGEDSTAILSGFTITNGFADFGGGISFRNNSIPILKNLIINGNSANRGGGIYCHNSNPNLSGLNISDNSAYEDGGGVYLYYNSNPTIVNTNINWNSALNWGGGLDFGFDSNPTLMNVIIKGNTATNWYGGGINMSYNSNPTFSNVIIVENSAFHGGGLSISQSNPSLNNVILTGNSAYQNGGAIYSKLNSHMSLSNVTISENSATYYGKGIYFSFGSTASIVNSIIWENSTEGICFSSFGDLNTITISHSDVYGGEEGIVTNDNGIVNWLEGNIDSDPLFTNPENSDFNLQAGSPCIDAGTSFLVWQGDTLINLPDSAYNGNAIDMGAYESPYGAGIVNEPIVPTQFTLDQNFPNPFNPVTTISYQLPELSFVNLSIYNVIGQLVETLVNKKVQIGYHNVTWNSKNVGSGVYFYRITADNYSATGKCLLIR